MVRSVVGPAAAMAVATCLLCFVALRHSRSAVELSQLPGEYFIAHPGDDEGGYFTSHPTQYDQNGKPFVRNSRKMPMSLQQLSQLTGDYFVAHPGDDEGPYFTSHPTQSAENGKPFAKSVQKMQLRSLRTPTMREIFPQTPDWQYTPNSVGQGDGSIPGQETNVFDNGYMFPDYARRGQGWDVVYVPQRSSGFLRPHLRSAGGQQLWGGQYSSVGKFPVGYRGQLTEGGEWNVWALPTEEQMQQMDGGGPDCPCAQYDSPLQTIGEVNVLDDIGNDPDGAVWNPEAPAEVAARCSCNK